MDVSQAPSAGPAVELCYVTQAGCLKVKRYGKRYLIQNVSDGSRRATVYDRTITQMVGKKHSEHILFKKQNNTASCISYGVSFSCIIMLLYSTDLASSFTVRLILHILLPLAASVQSGYNVVPAGVAVRPLAASKAHVT